MFHDGGRAVGMVVDRILDVVEDEISMRSKAVSKGLLGSAVVGGQVADFLDLNYVIRCASNGWFEEPGSAAGEKTILLAEESLFRRSLLRSALDMAGYRVLEARNLDDAMRIFQQRPVDIVLAALDFPPGGSAGLLNAMRARPECTHIPVVGLAESTDRAQSGHSGLEECQLYSDREAMLESVARLAKALEKEGALAAA